MSYCTDRDIRSVLIFDILPAELEKNPAGHAMQEDAPIITTASKKYPVRRIQGCSYPCAHYKMERYLSCVFLCVYLKVKKVKQNDELCTYLALSQSLDPWWYEIVDLDHLLVSLHHEWEQEDKDTSLDMALRFTTWNFIRPIAHFGGKHLYWHWKP